MERQTQLNWMRDILEHLRTCYDQWQVADERGERYLADAMKRDCDEFRRLCDTLPSRRDRRQKVLAA